jgi:uncharacterized alpha-E superfamily protein
MMNRFAQLLFWTGRYMERAENHARLIDVNYHMRHEIRGNQYDQDYVWEKLVAAVEDVSSFKSNHSIANERNALHFLTFESSNSNSIYSLIQQTRSNIRTLRQLLPGELWETVNSFYLWLKDQDVHQMMLQSPYMFYQRIREWVLLFNGAADSMMTREQEWHFIQAGKYLERTENTARILHNISANLSNDNNYSQEQNNYHRMIVLLKSVGGYEAFRKFHANDVTFAKVLEFLLFNPGFPRSIHFALTSLESYLKVIKQEDYDYTLLSVKAILDGLDDRHSGHGGSDLLHDLLQSCNQLGYSISKTFFQEEIVGA